MRPYAITAVILSLSLGFGCMAEGDEQTAHVAAGIESVYSDIDVTNCERHVDLDDPNESPYHLCPGVLGYSLLVRVVGSGRQSIDVLTPEGETYPLDYHEFVTRHMTQLGGQAEWRVSMDDGENVPVALIVPVEAHENEDEPEQITTRYLAVAKITRTALCVTDRVVEGSLDRTSLLRVADSSPSKPCLDPRPPMVSD